MPKRIIPQRASDPRIVVDQMQVTPGDVQANLEHMLASIDAAKRAKADIIVFPELATSGYLLGDRFEESDFLDEITAANETLFAASEGIIVIWGSILTDDKKHGEDGRMRKYNCAFIAQDGKAARNGILSGYAPKTNLPKYRMFDDARHFTSTVTLATETDTPVNSLLYPFKVTLPSSGKSLRIGLTICEDLWDDDYATKPAMWCKANGADIIINISCSPWTAGKCYAREKMLRRRAQETELPILYVNAVGLQNNVKNLIWFDGGSTLIAESGEILWRAKQHEQVCESPNDSMTLDPLIHETGIREIKAALVAAMREFYRPFKKVVIGLSGGIDSALMLALLAEALDSKKILAINMPTQFNSQTTQDLARECASNFDVEYRVVPIGGLLASHLAMLASAGYPEPQQLVIENVQARIRSASVLAAIAQAENGVFTCNGNKTEMALNYFTLYGDGAGVAAFLADLWKGGVYQLATYINRCALESGTHRFIPRGIIELIPSAELSADQNVDEGKGDPIFYPYHDNLLRAFTELRWTPATVIQHLLDGNLEEKLGCPEGTLKKYFTSRKQFVDNLEWAWERYNVEWKRAQTPPVFIISRRAFGFDRRDTIAAAPPSAQYERLVHLYLHADDASNVIGI
jgi:NAD+ synthase (glutamine-hydrolysing)